ncbi:hypothetical protein [Hypericibacter sp.]|uniref:hypothetical protein n=1 Tax=Hypericibacter sp. TaxID=2705401 RepID=UPI003D6D5C9A
MAKTHGFWIAALFLLPTVALAAETPDESQPVRARSILADQVREQGHACSNAIEAHRDPELSRPDMPVWILSCSNATYRISVRPDMAARIETIRP